MNSHTSAERSNTPTIRAVPGADLRAPVLLAVGVFARWGALAIAFDMLMAILVVGQKRVLTGNQARGWGVELELSIGIGAVTIAIAGTARLAALRDS